jgi:predicted nucleic acid-binding protein
MLSVDTNIFIYAVDQSEPEKQPLAMEVGRRAQAVGAAIALQVCGEFYSASTRRLKRAPWEAAQASRNLMTAFPTFNASRTAVERALAEAAAGRFSYWDGLLLASADEAGCTALLSEDMADGLRFGGVEIVNPFAGDRLSDRAVELLGAA